jgi:hypothetical protein
VPVDSAPCMCFFSFSMFSDVFLGSNIFFYIVVMASLPSDGLDDLLFDMYKKQVCMCVSCSVIVVVCVVVSSFFLLLLAVFFLGVIVYLVDFFFIL